MNHKVTVFLALVISSSVTYGSVSYYLLSPAASQPFLAFALVSTQGTLSNYTQGNGLSVPINQTMDWRLQITNRLGSLQFVRVVYKIGNLNDTSTAAALGSTELFIAYRQTGNVSFAWSILSKSNQTNGIIFPRLMINGQAAFSSPIGAVAGKGFRFIFELWTFDLDSNSFQYGWRGPGGRGPPLQAWFDIGT